MFEWIVSTMGEAGYAGVAFLMFIENVFPPIPSEIVMPLAGFLSARGAFWLPLAIAVGTFGSVAGATFWYWVGHRVGPVRLRAFAEKHGRWLTISGGDVDAASLWFHRNGAWAVLVGRFLPGLRTLISVPAGIARMPLGRFLLYTTLGSLVWTTGLATLGYLLESQYDRVQGWIDPVGTAMLAALVTGYLWRLLRQARR